MDERYDVVVIGGGAARLGGALTLARARRSVLVVDAGEPRNAPAGKVHNYLGREGTPPAEVLSIGRGEVVRDRAVGVVARGALGVRGALMWRQWTDDVVLFLHTGAEPTADELEQLAARNVRVVRGEVAGLEGGAAVRLDSGEVVDRDAVVVAPVFGANTDVLAGLGATPVPLEMNGTVMGTHLPADPTGRTDIPGVWVAGNAGDLSAQVIVAAAQGLRAGAMINADLIAEDTRAAVAQRGSVAA